MSSINTKITSKSGSSRIASKIPTSGRDSGTHSRSSSVSNLTTASDIHSEIGDASSENPEDLKMDERVWVNGTKPGYIKFIGKTQFAPGVWAGILLDESVGKNDGSVGGVKYFTCDPLRGIFARPAKLTRTPGAISATGDASMVGSVTPKASSGLNSSRLSLSSNISSCTTPRQYSKLRVGEQITVSSLGGLKPGTLRYIGETDFAKGEWAGIELDEPTGKNDGSVAGKRYFTCLMKYGLFAPLHKVSRAIATSASRPGSVRGSSLLRSNSRDSLNSSISNASRTSRVKLGVTSLTNSQKSKISTGSITTPSKALQDALKEKEQHIEQLLKERELERSEFARITSHYEEMEAKSSELEKKQKKTELDRKGVEEQLTAVHRRLEDIQFQLEEEKITKSDFETQLQQRNLILKRIEDFVSKESGEKFLNIKEILAGQEALSEISEKSDTSLETEELKGKVTELETSLKQLCDEKQEIFNQLTELQKSAGDNALKSEILIASLNTTVQEKDDMISNLKNELNSNIEKVTQLIEDNRNLSEQILLKEQQAKGHADDVIKELGEKVSSLNEELKAKSCQLGECLASIQEKDSKISTLEQSLDGQTSALSQLQSQYKNMCDSLEQNEAKLAEKVVVQQSLEETIAALKSQGESDSEGKQQKINLLDEELKIKTCQINEYLASVQEKENLLASLQQNFDTQVVAVSQLQNEQKSLNEMLKQKDIELGEKAGKQKSLDDQIAALQSQNEMQIAEKEKKMLGLVKEIENLTNCVQEKEYQLVKAQSELSLSQANIEKLDETIQQLSDNIQQADLRLCTAEKDSLEKIKALQNELSTLNQEKDQMKLEYGKELEVLKSNAKVKEEELEAKNAIIVQHESQISLLSEKLNKSESEYSVLKNDLTSLAEKDKDLCKEKENIEGSLKAKEESITEFRTQVENLKTLVDKSNLDFEQKEKQLLTLQESMNVKEEENNQLVSKLQLAEQKVEMLNRDSSEHVMALQNELSKLKEESTSARTHLEQELSKMKSEKEKLSEIISNKEKCLKEKEESLTSLEQKVKEKDIEVTNLSLQKEELFQSVSRYNVDIEVQQKNHQEIISSSQSEYEAKLSEKEKELGTIRNDNEKLILTISEKEKALIEKDDVLGSLQKKLEVQVTEMSNLSTQNSELVKNIAKFSSDIEEEQKLHQEKLSSSMMEYDNLLKEKDQAIQNIQSELKKCTEGLEINAKVLKEKEKEINALKNIVKEKDSQFDELSQMIESNRSQMILLKEQNNKNESLLQNQESFISNFKTEQERKLHLKEQSFKEDIARLEALIQNKEDENKQKDAVILNLTSEIQEQKSLVESLQTQLETAKTDKQKISKDSSNVYQEFNNRIAEMEVKYAKLLEEKEKISKEDKKTKEDKKSLELVCDSLLQEKSAQEEVVKDREAKLEALQAVVNHLQTEFSQHKQELQQKLDVSQMELQAVSELKNQLELQHSVCEELQQELQSAEEKCKELEDQIKIIPHITSEKNKLQTEIEEFQKTNKERSEMIANIEERNQIVEEQLNNNKNLCLQKDKELLSLREQLQKLRDSKVLFGNLDSSVKSLEEENKSLKNKITLLEIAKSEKKSEIPEKTSAKDLTPEETEEKESLLSQIDFLNSIIVDMKQKNEELTRQLEIQSSCWEESDVNLNDTKKAIAPRLFCDICDMFDLHETCDCPKQESFVDEEEVPQLRRPGTRKLEERPYCNNCEVFGHWTLDCDEQDTF